MRLVPDYASPEATCDQHAVARAELGADHQVQVADALAQLREGEGGAGRGHAGREFRAVL